ncbi:hypothetical protein B6D60_03765 [candidate division KSB1 bacterium 4484_87]|nr:MAG: hypothetical protein B6D60_03765 [candidate division KSB1 bacterium 4484_87]
MDKYYFLVAELPTLFFDREPEVTIEYFLSETEKWMSSRDFQILSQVDINNYLTKPQNPRVLRDFQQFESALRTDLARFREAQKQKTDYKPASIPQSLIKEGNPLEIEIKLLELRWKLLDEMQREHHFDLAYLILYYLKLQILQRYMSFSKEKGMEKFQKLYEVIYESGDRKDNGN